MAGGVALFPIFPEGGNATGVAADPTDGTVWFTLTSSNNIGRLDPVTGESAQFPLPTPNAGVGSITYNPHDGNFWFVETAANQIGKIDSVTHAITEYPLLTTAGAELRGITTDAKGNVWFTEQAVSKVGMLNIATGAITDFSVTTIGAEPYDIVNGPDGNLWFTEAGANQVAFINPVTDRIQELPIPSSGVSNDQAEGIAVGPDNNIWFTEVLANAVGKVDLANSYAITTFALTSPYKTPGSIVGAAGKVWYVEINSTSGYDLGSIDPSHQNAVANTPVGFTGAIPSLTATPDGNLWFPPVGGNQLDKLDVQTGKVTKAPYNATTAHAAAALTAGPDGTLWFSQTGTVLNGFDEVGTIDPASHITTLFAGPTASSSTFGITNGPDGKIWFTEPGGGKIGTIDPSTFAMLPADLTLPTSGAEPYAIVGNPKDGWVWFTELNKNQIGRVIPSTGSISDNFVIPTANSRPSAITVDPNGNLWFTESNAGALGELNTTTGKFSEWTLPNGFDNPASIAFGPDGNVWFTEGAGVGSKVAAFSPVTDTVVKTINGLFFPIGGTPNSITVGPDKNIWFSEPSSKKIAMVDLSNGDALTEYSTGNFQAQGIAPGPDGDIWFSLQSTNLLGVLPISAATTPTQLAVTTPPPNSVDANAGFGIIVSVKNAAGDLVTDYTGPVTVTLASNPGNSTSFGTYIVNAVNGVAVFAGLGLDKPGTGYTIQATAPGLTSTTTSAFNVTPAATHLVITTPPSGSIVVGSPIGLEVSAEDDQGNVDPSFSGVVWVSLTSGPSGTALGGTLAVNGDAGVAIFTGLSLNKASANTTLQFSSGALAGASINLAVGQDSTATSLSAPTSSPVVGQPVQLTATVTVLSPGSGAPTGTVTFKDGGSTLGTAPLKSTPDGFTAILTTTALSLGGHSITAVYGGDSNDIGSTSSAQQYTIAADSTTTAVASLPTSSAFGQSVTLTATVSVNDPGTGNPTGTVTFKDGGTTLGDGVLSTANGLTTATFTTSALTVGLHAILAVYNGDDADKTSTSTALSLSVGQAATQTTVAASVNPTVLGQQVTFTATVSVLSPGAGTPGGVVTFKDGSTTLGTGLLGTDKGVTTATFSIPSLAVASHTITAVYGGDTNDKGSTSSALTFSVGKDDTTTTAGASINPSVFGQSVTFTATVKVAAPGAGTPGGTVTFKEGSLTLGTGTLSTSNGVTTAKFSTASLATGPHTITAFYGGDDNDNASASTAQSFTVGQDSTTTTIALSSSKSVFGQLVTFTATVGVTNPGAGDPTGTVTFMEGSTSLGTGTLSTSNGVTTATLTMSSLAVAQHAIHAEYGGDTNDKSSSSSAKTLTVGKDATTTTVTASDDSLVVGQAVTLTATVVVANPGAGAPGGTVTFKDGTTTLGTGSLSTANGVTTASFATSDLAVGQHIITASYFGDTNDLASASPAKTLSVGLAHTTTGVAPSLTGSVVGQSVTFTATVSIVSPGAGTSTGTVTFKDGATTLGTGPLSTENGVTTATFTTASLAVGPHSVIATYGGDTNNEASASAALSFNVGQDATSTSVDSTASSTVAGQQVTFTATVSVSAPGAGSPTGTVTFMDGASTLGSGPLSTANGITTATFTTSDLSVDAHTITAVYGGDSKDLGSSSSELSHTVGPRSTATVLGAVEPTVFGQQITFTATVTVSNPGVGTPTGSVAFKDGTTLLGTSNLQPIDGVITATFSTATLPAGQHVITAVYAGDLNDAGSTSPASNFAVGQDTTTTTLAASDNPLIVGQSVTFTATVHVSAPGGGIPKGIVTFKDGNKLLGTAKLKPINGVATVTFATKSLGQGTHTIIAVYSGDLDDLTSNKSLAVQVGRFHSSSTIAVSANPLVFGQFVTLTATVRGVGSGAPNPIGSVAFKDGTTTLGTVKVTTVNEVTKATLKTRSLAVGQNPITVNYLGDANDVSSKSAPLIVTVKKDASVTSVVSSLAKSVVGQSVTFTATVSAAAPGGGIPTGIVTFKSGSTTLGTAILKPSNGVAIARFVASSLALGSATITAEYGGDQNFTPSKSKSITQQVAQASTSTALSTPSTTVTAGTSVDLTAVVVPVPPGGGIPGASVTFMEGTKVLGTVALSKGRATLSISTLAKGKHTLTAVYSGGPKYLRSISAALTLTIT